ncbi:MAG: SIMPL domain-containing protein [Nitrososphaeraceae archaeon]
MSSSNIYGEFNRTIPPLFVNQFNESTLSVMGTSSLTLKPDKVVLSFIAESTEDSANKSLVSNSKKLDNVITELLNIGITKDELKTSGFNLSPNYNYSDTGTRLNITGYTATNTLVIESNISESIPEWIDIAVNNGIDNIRSILFMISKERIADAKNQLIKEASMDAINKAKISLSYLNKTIIDIKDISIDPTILTPYSNYQKDYVTRQSFETSLSSSIIPGEEEIFSTVKIVFIIS